MSRNYKAEYARRVARGKERGHSRSQARGHAKASEALLRQPSAPLSEDRVQVALAALRRDKSIARAAKEVKVSAERLRRFAVENDIIEKVRGRWQTKASLPRVMRFVSRQRPVRVKLPDFEAASQVGRYSNALRRFLESNQVSELRPFEGQGVRDASGKYHPFETDPNTLYRLAASGETPVENIYRVVI